VAKRNPYKQLTNEEQVAIVERQAATKQQELWDLDVDWAQLNAVPTGSRDEAWKGAQGQLAKRRQETQRLSSALAAKADAMRGRPLSQAERKQRDRAVAGFAIERLTTLLRTWAEKRLEHEALAEAGDKSAPHKDTIAGIDRAMAAAEAKIAELQKI
jgi:hypothetical protein